MKKLLIIMALFITLIIATLFFRKITTKKYYQAFYSNHHNVWVIGDEIETPAEPIIFISGIDIYSSEPELIGVYRLTNSTIYYDEYRGYFTHV